MQITIPVPSLAALSGKKTYLISLALLGYAVYLYFWTGDQAGALHYVDQALAVAVALGGTGLAALRAGVSKSGLDIGAIMEALAAQAIPVNQDAIQQAISQSRVQVNLPPELTAALQTMAATPPANMGGNPNVTPPPI